MKVLPGSDMGDTLKANGALDKVWYLTHLNFRQPISTFHYEELLKDITISHFFCTFHKPSHDIELSKCLLFFFQLDQKLQGQTKVQKIAGKFHSSYTH